MQLAPEAEVQDAASLAVAVPAQSEVGALALITLSPEKYAAEVYEPFKTRLASAIDSVKAIDYDIKTTAGMAVAVKARALFRDLRVEADKERKARKEPIIKIGKLLESGFDSIEERVQPLELHFDADIAAEVQRKADEKAERECLNRERIAAIRAKIDAILGLPAKHAGAASVDLVAALTELAQRTTTAEEFAELADEAALAVETVATALMTMRDKAIEREAAAIALEQARIAEIARIEAERRELDELRAAAAEAARLAKIESDRIAAEQATERQRMDEQRRQQEAELQRQRDAEAARVRANQAVLDQTAAELRAAQEQQRMAMSEISGIQQQAIIAQVGRSPYVKGGDSASYAQVLAETKAWPIEEENFGPLTGVAQMAKNTAIAALEQGLAACIERDHAEALQMNEQINAEREAERLRLQALADQHLADNLPLPESLTEADALIDAGQRPDIADLDIIDVISTTFDLTRAASVERLAAIDFVALRVACEVAA